MSLLLDALKQAEKSKQEKAAAQPDAKAADEMTSTLDAETLKAALPDAGARLDPDLHSETEELSIAPMDMDLDGHPTGAMAAPPADTDTLDTDAYQGDHRLTVDESQSLSIDLEKFADELADVPAVGIDTGELTGDVGNVTGQQQVGEGSMTMPSMKNVQRSLNDFYTEGTGVMSTPEPSLPDEAPPEPVAATTPQRASEDTGGTTNPSRRAASNVFAAKKTGASRRAAWLGVTALLLLLVLGGAYFWFTMQDTATPFVPRQAARLPAPAAVTPAPSATPLPASTPSAPLAVAEPAPVSRQQQAEELAMATSVATAAETEVASVAAAAEAEVASIAAADPAPPVASAPVAAVEAQARVDTTPSSQAAAAATVASRDVTPAAMPIRIKRQRRADPGFALVKDAYADFTAGRVFAAEEKYQRALAQRPANRDALLGLAAVATYRGDVAQAEHIYRTLLSRNPQDAAARAGMVAIKGGLDPVASESQLKLMLDKSPEADWLHFSLGNVYAGQSRWAEAQQAYFNAWQVQPENADYLYNLAVALDHLGQHNTALDFYRRAQHRADSQPAQFDVATVQQRIAQLGG